MLTHTDKPTNCKIPKRHTSSTLVAGAMKLVEIQWLDATGADGWTTEKSLLKETPAIHNSVGYVIKENKEHITITMSFDEERESLGAWLLIPKSFIKKIKKLK